MKTRIFSALSLLLLLTIACNLSAGPTPPPQATAEVAGSPTPTPPPDPIPVSFNEEVLASLNSYRFTIMFKSSGPDPAQSSTTIIESQRSNDTNASATHITATVVSPDGGDPETSDTTMYDIGNDQCSGSDVDGWEWTSTTPAEAEMQGLVKSMVGMTPVIDDPVFAATETVNGVPTNHFSFQVSGLGTSSGSIVSINRGDYWLAVDGQYIVKYLLILEMSEAGNSDVLHQEISLEMKDINQPVSIAFPQGCLDVAPPPTTTP